MTGNSQQETDPVVVQTTGGKLIHGWIYGRPLRQTDGTPGLTSFTVIFPSDTYSLMWSPADDTWNIVTAHEAGKVARAIWIGQGSNGACVLDADETYNIASVTRNGSGIYEIELSVPTIGGIALPDVALPSVDILDPTGLASDETPDVLIRSISNTPPHYIVDSMSRNKNGQTSQEDYTGGAFYFDLT